jgi:hypothetical protein
MTTDSPSIFSDNNSGGKPSDPDVSEKEFERKYTDAVLRIQTIEKELDAIHSIVLNEKHVSILLAVASRSGANAYV